MDYLWTPWRYQYMTQAAGGENPECIFCDAVAKKKDGETLIVHRGAKAFGEILRRRVEIERVKHRNTAHRLAKHGDPRGIDLLQPRQVVQCRVGVECLGGQSAAAGAGDAARTGAVDGQRDITPGAEPIGDRGRMAGEAAAAMQHDHRRTAC